MKLSPKKIRAFQQTVWDYYRKHGRQFPWRETNDSYSILVSEVMLQQTQADRVAPFFKRWMKEFPTVRALARAPLKKVLLGWSGLGYNRRALYLKRAAEVTVREHGGAVPRDLEKLNALPGIGPYIAAAVLAFAWNEPTIFIETNIRTVYLHFFFKGRKMLQDKEILNLVEQTLPVKVQPFSRFKVEPCPNTARQRSGLFPDSRPDLKDTEPCSVREWYSALMDYGAMLKRTEGNPNARSAHYAKQKKFAGSRRELRGKILRRATLGKSVVPSEFKSSAFSVSEVLSDLVREGFLRKEGRVFKLQ